MQVPLGLTTLRFSQRSALLALLALALVGVGGYDYLQQSRAMNDTVPVEATVTNSSVDVLDGGRGIDYEPEIRYWYRYQGETYTSDRVFPGSTIRTYNSSPAARSIVDSYQPNTTVRAYVLPSNPDRAFLIRERTPWPAQALTGGAAGLVVAVLAGLGSQQPGRQEPRPASDVDASQRTWFDRNGERLRRLSKRLLAGCFVAFWLSMVGLVFGLASVPESARGPLQTVEAGTTDPIGLALLAAAGFWVGMVLSLCLYGVWSFEEYRRLRRRLPEPRPPSPFRHPSRLVTILGTEGDELSGYGRRVRLTGWAFVVAAGMVVVVGDTLVTAG